MEKNKSNLSSSVVRRNIERKKRNGKGKSSVDEFSHMLQIDWDEEDTSLLLVNVCRKKKKKF